MNDLDRDILNALQNDFPIESDPYDRIAEKLGISVEKLWERVERLLEDGTIRRIGASLNSRKMGFPSTLCAARVAPEQTEAAAEFIGRYCEVTHSYLRNGDFNIWFTLIARDEQRIEEVLEEIRSELGLEQGDVLNLPMRTTFKLNARFRPPA